MLNTPFELCIQTPDSPRELGLGVKIVFFSNVLKMSRNGKKIQEILEMCWNNKNQKYFLTPNLGFGQLLETLSKDTYSFEEPLYEKSMQRRHWNKSKEMKQ